MKEKAKILVSLLVISILIFSTTFRTFAVTQQDLDEIQDEIDKKEEEIDNVQANLTEALKNIDAIKGDITEVEYNLSSLEKELTTLQSEIDTLETELQKKVEEYDIRYENACMRIESQYLYGNVTILDLLLKSTSLTDFLSNYYMVEELLKDDETFLEELEVEKQEIEGEKKTLDDKKQKLESQKLDFDKQKLTLANKKNEQQKLYSNLTAEEAKLQKEIDELAQQYDAKQEEFRRIAAQAGNSGGSYSGGQLACPCKYTRISSYFGSRGSPLAGGSSYHKGIDMAAPKGTAITAAESGTVIAVYTGCVHNYGKERSCGCGGGFGNYVMVNHGGGLVTMYGHCTSINVSNGSKVSRGQTIATVGSTGASTGYHLHFGVLVNGTYVNPAPYIGL